MRFYFGLTALFILILGFGIVNLNILANNTERITGNFDQIYQSISDQDWQKADRQISQSEKSWNHHKKWWTVVIDHQEIDNIDISFARISEYIKHHNQSLAAGELMVLRQFLDHIPENETVNLKNIF